MYLDYSCGEGFECEQVCYMKVFYILEYFFNMYPPEMGLLCQKV